VAALLVERRIGEVGGGGLDLGDDLLPVVEELGAALLEARADR
jgi:hypothetical protein